MRSSAITSRRFSAQAASLRDGEGVPVFVDRLVRADLVDDVADSATTDPWGETEPALAGLAAASVRGWAALRPPVAADRLRLTTEGLFVIELRRRWSDGTTHLVFDPVELLERLAALTPRPRINLGLYYGVLGTRAAWRPTPVGRAHRGPTRHPTHPRPSGPSHGDPGAATGPGGRPCSSAVLRIPHSATTPPSISALDDLTGSSAGPILVRLRAARRVLPRLRAPPPDNRRVALAPIGVVAGPSLRNEPTSRSRRPIIGGSVNREGR